MTKTLGTYIIVFGLLLLASFNLHSYFIDEHLSTMLFSLKEVYVFHATASFSICFLFFIISKRDNLKHQLGYLYLGTFFLKLILFAIIFSSLFSEEVSLNQLDKVSLIIPLFIFLAAEVYFIAKILAGLNTDNK